MHQLSCHFIWNFSSSENPQLQQLSDPKRTKLKRFSLLYYFNLFVKFVLVDYILFIIVIIFYF